MFKFFEKPKLKVVIITLSCFIFLTSALIAIACINATKNGTEQPPTATESEELHINTDSVPVAKEPSIYDYLELQRNANGYTLTAVRGYTESVLLLPATAPDGEQINAIGDNAFSECTSLVEITLPATVKRIGNGCFAGASSLMIISVEPANASFSSVGGVLFSRDKTELICYPAAKVGERYLLSTSVKKIAPYAFDGVKELRAILYEGSAAKYQSIDIGIGNQIFSSLPVTCNYKAAK